MSVRIVVRNVLTQSEPSEASYSFDKNVITIGRHEACDVPLQDRSVSRDHARIFYEHGGWKVEDVGSSKGTMLNERMLQPYQPVPLVPGEPVIISPYRIELSAQPDFDEDTPPSLGAAEGDESVTSAMRSNFLRWMDQNFGGEPPSLMVLDGHSAGREIRLEDLGRDWTLGRGTDCSATFQDESISRHHARLRRGLSGVEITDLKSRNHVFVNGQQVQSAVLQSGDEIRLGKVRMKFKDPVSLPSVDVSRDVDPNAQTTANVEVGPKPPQPDDSGSIVIAPLRPLEEVPFDLEPAPAGVVRHHQSPSPIPADVVAPAPPSTGGSAATAAGSSKTDAAAGPTAAGPASAAAGVPEVAHSKAGASSAPMTGAASSSRSPGGKPTTAGAEEVAAAPRKPAAEHGAKSANRARKAAPEPVEESGTYPVEPERSALMVPLLVAFFAMLVLAAIVVLALMFR